MGTKKSFGTKTSESESPLELTYYLRDLPTSQHRAGLVGMVMLVRYTNALGTPTSEAAVRHIDAHSSTFTFTRTGMQALFDCAYDTAMGEIAVDKPYKNRNKEEVPPLRVETEKLKDKKGKMVARNRYIYPKPIPKGAFLSDCDPSGTEGVWIKLWRDMLWSIPRGVPATRRAFEARGDGEVVNDGLQMYNDLKESKDKSVPLASTYFLGAQANTADNVAFADAASRQLLLHFWPFVVELFVPAVLSSEGETEFDGYVFAFPDVVDLDSYCSDYLEFLRGRSSEKKAYLPKAAVIDLPDEAGLRTLSRLANLLTTHVQQGGAVSLDDLLLAVDVIHARKDGNNIRILSSSRVEPKYVMSGEYQRLMGAGFWSHVFRRQLVTNLLADRPWYTDFGRILATYPPESTFDAGAFQHDARTQFREETRKMTEGESSLPALLYRVGRNYLGGMLQSKHQLAWDEETKKNPREYYEKKAKVAREALLAMRSRTDSDFVQYVTTTVFSVHQGMTKEDYVRVADALLKDTETFRTLLMLAISAQMPRDPKSDSNSD